MKTQSVQVSLTNPMPNRHVKAITAADLPTYVIWVSSRYETAEHKTHNFTRSRPPQTKIFSHQCGGHLQPVGGLNPPNSPDKSNAGYKHFSLVVWNTRPSDRRVPSNCCVSSVPARLWYLAACDQWKCQRFHCNKAQHSITFTITAHLTTYQFIFTILHLCRVVLAMSEMSVRLSVKRVSCDQTKETSAHIFIPRARSSILVFWQEKWLAGTTSCVYCHVKLFLFKHMRYNEWIIAWHTIQIIETITFLTVFHTLETLTCNKQSERNALYIA